MDDDLSDEQEYDYRKRGYLLPEGCKDLVDVFESGSRKSNVRVERIPPNIEPFVSGKVALEPMTVRELASVLSQRVVHILKDLLELDVVALPDRNLDSETLFRLLT